MMEVSENAQGPQRERPPHAGADDCRRDRHDWKFVAETTQGDLYRCRCCGEEDTD